MHCYLYHSQSVVKSPKISDVISRRLENRPDTQAWWSCRDSGQLGTGEPRWSLSKAGRSRDTSRARETITSAINAKENKESKASGTRSSSRGREMVVERKEERRERGRSRARDLQVPMTLRQPFLGDPFFKGTLKSLESTRDDFFKQARQSFEESLKQMESRMSNAL